MRHHLSAAAVAAIVAAGITLFLPRPATPPAHEPIAATQQQESAYDRVMRTGTLRCAYIVWPPYLIKDVNTGELSGVTHDVFETAAKTLNIRIEWSGEYIVGQQLETLKSGRADALCHDGPWTRSAMPFLAYSTPLFYVPVYLYMKTGNVLADSDIISLFNSPDHTLSALDGDLSLDLAQSLLPQAKLVTLPNSADASLLMENVTTDKADGVIIDPLSVEFFNQGKEVQLQLAGDGTPVAVYPVVLSTLPHETALLDMLNRSFNFLADTGQISQIIRKYDPSMKAIWPPVNRYQLPGR